MIEALLVPDARCDLRHKQVFGQLAPVVVEGCASRQALGLGELRYVPACDEGSSVCRAGLRDSSSLGLSVRMRVSSPHSSSLSDAPSPVRRDGNTCIIPQTKIQEEEKQFALNAVTVGDQVAHVADLVQSSSSLLHVRQLNSRDSTDRSLLRSRGKFFQHLHCTICHRNCRLTELVGLQHLPARVWASRHLSSEMSDGWRVRILLVHVELSSHPFFYFVSVQV